MSSNALTLRAPIRSRSRVLMRVPADQSGEERRTGNEVPSRRSALRAVADQASPSVRGHFRIFAIGDR